MRRVYFSRLKSKRAIILLFNKLAFSVIFHFKDVFFIFEFRYKMSTPKVAKNRVQVFGRKVTLNKRLAFSSIGRFLIELFFKK